jgi:sialate O-acetylesterase
MLSDFVSMLKLAQIYQDNMVLQRAPHKTRLWGYGSEQMTRVSLMLYDKVYSTDTSKVNWTNLYVWTIELEPIKADKKPIDIEITETSQTGMIIHTVLLKNVLFGDVWICGGQSNMNFELHKAFEWDRESKIVESFEHLRVTCVSERNSSIALNDLDHDPLIAWSMPSQVSLHNFSAVCWYFGKELSTRIDVPIGIFSIFFHD